MAQRVEGNSNLLLQYACRLESFKQRRKIDNPEIIPIKSQETIKNPEPLQEVINLTENDTDLINVTAHSIKNSGLFFSVPLIKDCNAENRGYDDEVLKKTFKNCLINAYYLQALSNLKEFYRQEEVKNTQSTQQSEQEQNREKTTQSPLNKIKTAKNQEKDKILKKINGEKKLEQEGLSIKIDTNDSSEQDSSESMTNTDSTKYIPDNISPLSSIASYDTLAFNSSSLTEDTNYDTSPLSPTEVQSCKTPETPRTPHTL